MDDVVRSAKVITFSPQNTMFPKTGNLLWRKMYTFDFSLKYIAEMASKKFLTGEDL